MNLNGHSKHYAEFLDRKTQLGSMGGFKPLWMPDSAFDFQQHLIDWSVRKGRSAIFADCGLGKTLMQLAVAENIVRHTNGRVLILTPLAVAQQTVREGEKFGIECARSTDGKLPPQKIVVANYDRLHYFNPSDFAGVVCDESSRIKHFTGATQKQVTRFMLKIQYRLLCTATAAPNDYTELGTSSEALGELGYTDMLSRFFVMDDKKRCRMNDVKLARAANTGNHYAKLAYRVSQTIGQWRMKGHAETAFWQWVCYWARACRMPSDLGFENGDFVLPALTEQEHEVKPKCPANGMLFTIPALGLREERDERRRTLTERCELVASLANHKEPVVVWCHYNQEGDVLEKMIPDSVQVSGNDSDEVKEEAYMGFADGRIRVLVIKPKIGAWGMNWQHCAHVITFASHSYEQYYQSVRRCWRFGQKRPVKVDIIASTGEQYVSENMARKRHAAGIMFEKLVTHMNEAARVVSSEDDINPNLPSWITK